MAKGGNYLKMLLAMADSGNYERGHAYFNNIEHDHWCGIFNNAPCNCSPDIEVLDLEKPTDLDRAVAHILREARREK